MGDRVDVGVARLGWEPGLGGKITSLRLRGLRLRGLRIGGPGCGGHGREWLAPPVRARAVPLPGQDWGELDCSGWDECLPNIAAAPEAGLADHGDVWRTPWTVTPGAGMEGGAGSGSVAPPHRTYRFVRNVAIDGNVLRVAYSLTNLGDRPLPWAWAQHMLLAADEQTRIVASSPMRLRLGAVFPDGAVFSRFSKDAVFSGDAVFPDGDMDLQPTAVIELGDMIGRAAKLWLEPPLPAVVAVVNGADWLAWRVADSSFPHLGLWLNLGGWGGEALRHVAVEPAFGAHDDPAAAYPDLEPLAPAAERTWRVLIEAGTGQSAFERFLANHRSPHPSSESE